MEKDKLPKLPSPTDPLPREYRVKFLHDCLKDDIRNVREVRKAYKEDPSEYHRMLLEDAIHMRDDTKKAIKELLYGTE